MTLGSVSPMRSLQRCLQLLNTCVTWARSVIAGASPKKGPPCGVTVSTNRGSDGRNEVDRAEVPTTLNGPQGNYTDEPDVVANTEVLYRSVRNDPRYFRTVDGQLRFSSQAFADRNQRPSVDRARLRQCNPLLSKKSETDGIISLVTADVRAVEINHNNPNGPTTYKIDVYAAPIQEGPGQIANLAHAEIRPTPEYETPGVFRKVLERLARLADQQGWSIPPGGGA